MRDIPPLNALRTFEAAARTGGFARAAEELCVTQSAISHQVRLLEDWFGVTMFERSGGRARLTPQGRALAHALGGAFSEIRTACRGVLDGAVGRPLNIAVIPSLAACWLIPRLSEFTAGRSDIAVRLMYAIHGQPIDLRQVDVAVVYCRGEPEIAGTTASALFEGAAVPVCSSLFLERHGPLDTPLRIVSAPLLHDTDWRGWSQWFMRATGRERAFDHGLMFEDFNLMRSAALSGQGVALCPQSIIRDDLESRRLVALSDIAVNDDFAYYLAEPTRPRPAAATDIAAFKAWLLDAAT